VYNDPCNTEQASRGFTTKCNFFVAAKRYKCKFINRQTEQ